MINEILSELSNPILSIIFTIIGSILAIIGIYYTQKYRRIKKIDMKWENNEIFNLSQLEEKDIKIFHKDVEINGLHKLKITFENSGTVVLRNEDFFQKPKIVFLSEVQILDVETDFDEDYINPSVQVDSGEIQLNIEFLEPSDKLIILILYSSKTVIGGKVLSKIIGGNKVDSIFSTNKEYEAYREGKLIGKAVYMFISMFIFFLVFWIISKTTLYTTSKYIQYLLGILILILSMHFSLKIGMSIQSKIEKNRIKKLIQKGELEMDSINAVDL